jgi:acyl dehydratase
MLEHYHGWDQERWKAELMDGAIVHGLGNLGLMNWIVGCRNG